MSCSSLALAACVFVGFWLLLRPHTYSGGLIDCRVCVERDFAWGLGQILSWCFKAAAFQTAATAVEEARTRVQDGEKVAGIP